MGIQPIDIQTLFTQLDKVSKTQVQLTQSAQLQSTLNQEEVSRKQNEKKATVEQAASLDDTLGTVHERTESRQQKSRDGRAKDDGENDEKTGENRPKESFSDPTLGRHIDISG